MQRIVSRRACLIIQHKGLLTPSLRLYLRMIRSMEVMTMSTVGARLQRARMLPSALD